MICPDSTGAKATSSGLIQDHRARTIITQGLVWPTPDIVFLRAPADCLATTAAIQPSWLESLPDVEAFPRTEPGVAGTAKNRSLPHLSFASHAQTAPRCPTTASR